jgi:hypothetical protein
MRIVRASVLAVLMIATSLGATTYIVPDDRYLISAAKAIVTGTVTGSHVRLREGLIETVTNIAVDEWIKGEGAPSIAIVLLGGQLGEERLTVSGMPSFSTGERVLLFLDRDGDGDWTTWAFALGAFRVDASGTLFTRSGEDIFGWTVDGARHVERPRLHREFLAYVRATVRGEDRRAEYFVERSPTAATPQLQPNATFPVGSYSERSHGNPVRRDGLRIAWRLSGNPGDLDLVQAVDSAIAVWNATTSRISDERSLTPASGNRISEDGESRVIANDPENRISDACCLGVVAFAMWWDHGTHDFNGQRFSTLTQADIVLNDGMTSATMSQARLNTVVTHEMGHTLGLRHADTGPNNSKPCGSDLNCCSDDEDGGYCRAVMNAAARLEEPGLQTWDRDAIACLYEGNCTATCVDPAFLEKPREALLYKGAETLLSAKVRGSPPFAVQWYVGPRGDPSNPWASNTWRLSVRPESTTDYWVRVTDACGHVDSDTTRITVVRCPSVVIASASATIAAPGQVRLRTIAAGGGAITYRWFRRNGPGEPETAISGNRELTIAYTEGTTFSVRVENRCGNSATSGVLTPSPTPPPVRRRNSRH